MTLNDTSKYLWEDFEKRVSNMIGTLFKIYPESANLKINGLMLRYIDAIDFDYSNNDVFNFLKEKMKISVEVYEGLFDEKKVMNSPLDFDLKFSFPSLTPIGSIQLRFVCGKKA